ncbi:hypothetical protein [Paenirhodobacter populi]|uniref:Uncharacterized protein n=1 Tax=Paenirhodobacter populi TaxID=2306993 RepID=A0A443JDJ9_9RHOB|nr:hypothetical protein [Sinirhodobacter populi]RWR18520.1 hypothetical protein D2T30_16145 [Sinirhodobacter populi]
MTLPRRYLFTVFEIAARLRCAPADIIEFSMMDRIRLSARIPFSEAINFCGLAHIQASEVFDLFPRDGSIARPARIRMFLPDESPDGWKVIPREEAIVLEARDILITAGEIEKFEIECELVPRNPNYRGGKSNWDWDGFYSALIMRIHNHGLPEHQKDLVDEMLGWFERRSDTGETPDPSCLRKKIAVFWRELNPG